MISIDTEVIKQLAAVVKSATEELESASQLLNQITVHNDWGCKERVTINSYIMYNRKKMQELMEASRGFTTVVGSIAEDFVKTESGIAQLFGGVESILKRVISIPVSTSITTPTFTGVIDSFTFEPMHTGGMYRLPFADGMAIVDFQNLLDGMENR